MTMTTLGSRQVWSAALSEVRTVTCSRAVPSSSQMTKVRWTPSRSRPSSAGPAPGEVRTATLAWARHTLTARRRVRRCATTTWASSQGMPARAKAAATEETRGDDLDLQAELGRPQGADDAEEARVPVGEDDGGAAVAGDAAGGEGDAAEPDALGVRGHFGERQVVGRTGHQRGGAEGGARRGGQRRAVPADHRDPVGHRRQSPEGRRRSSGQPARGPVRVPGVRWDSVVAGSRPSRTAGGSVPVDVRHESAGVGHFLTDAFEVLGKQAPDDEVGADLGPARPRCGCALCRRCAARPR